MKLAVAGLAIAMAVTGSAYASETGIPIADPYAGNKCFKLWMNVGGKYEEYAISLDGLPQKEQADLIIFAIQQHKSVTLLLREDLDSPYKDSFPVYTRCYDLKGGSTYWEYIVGVQVNQ